MTLSGLLLLVVKLERWAQEDFFIGVHCKIGSGVPLTPTTADTLLKVTLSRMDVLVGCALLLLAPALIEGQFLKCVTVSTHAQRHRPINTSCKCIHHPHSYAT